jgi:hypothetical protein
MADMAAAAKEAQGQAQADVAFEEATTPEALKETIEVDNGDFWGEPQAEAEELAPADEPAIEAADEESDELIPEDELVPQEESADAEGILTYKANGKDVQIDLRDPATLDALKKNLSFIDGARKAFSDKNKLRQEVKQLQAQAQEAQGYKESWDKLEAIKENPEQLYEVLTGEKFDDMIQRRVDQRAIYDSASEEERKIMDAESRMAALEKKYERVLQANEQEKQQAQDVRRDAEQRDLKTRMQQEFSKYEIFGEDPNSNRARKMLWQSAIYDLQDQFGNAKPTDEAIIAAFRDNANALQVTRKAGNTKKTEAARKAKAAKAKKSAAAAAQTPMKGSTPDELVGLDPLSLFNRFRGRK